MAMTSITWTGPFRYPGMVRFKVPADGSCLIHAILLAYNQGYRLEKQNGKATSRKVIVKKLRQELSNLLASPVDPLDPDSPRHYDLMARGSLAEMSSNFPRYSLAAMQKTLDSDAWLDYIFFEFIGDVLDKDIYILDESKQDIYMTGEEDLYQKGRPSIVLGYRSNHYELIGLTEENGVTRTLFFPDEDFITQLRTRQRQLTK